MLSGQPCLSVRRHGFYNSAGTIRTLKDNICFGIARGSRIAPGPLLSSRSMRKLLPSLVFGSGLVLYAAACSDSSGPKLSSSACTGTTFTLPSLQGKVMAAADLPCLTIPADGGTYVVVPQFATATAPLTPVSFAIQANTSTSATASVVAANKRIVPATTGATAD